MLSYRLLRNTLIISHLIIQVLTIRYKLPSVRIAGGLGGLNPYLTLPTPLPLVKIRPRGVEFQPPHLRFAEVGMLLYSHFPLMQFLKYLQRDDLNVTTILIHIEDYGLSSPGLSVKFLLRT